jgi:hypothetical protein
MLKDALSMEEEVAVVVACACCGELVVQGLKHVCTDDKELRNENKGQD